MKVLQCFPHTVIVDVNRHIIGTHFYLVTGIPESNTDSCVFEHPDIIFSVAESDDFIPRDFLKLDPSRFP